jgi:hypothetical protein
MATLPSIAEWMDELDTIPGLMDAHYSQARRQAGEGKAGVWQVSWSVLCSLEALSGDVLDDGELTPPPAPTKEENR